MTYAKQLSPRRYGKFTDVSVALLPGLNVVFGANEAGKTTLMTFTYQMLTGFPDRRKPELCKYFPEVESPEGAILLADEDGRECAIERVGKKESGHGPALADMLHGADAALLRNVFRIHQDDVHQFKMLKNNAQRDALISAGVVGAGTDARDARKALSERAALLGGYRKRKGFLNDLLEQVAKTESELTEARRLVGEYPVLERTVRELDGRLKELRSEQTTARNRRDRASMLLELHPVFNEWDALKHQIARWDGSEVTEAVIQEARKQATDIKELDEQLAGLNTAIDALATEETSMALDGSLWSIAGHVRKLELEVGGWEEQCRQAEAMRREVAALTQENAVLEASVGLGSTSAMEIAIDVKLEGELEAFGRARDQREAEVTTCRSYETEARRKLDEASAQFAEIPETTAEEDDTGSSALDDIEDLLELHRNLTSRAAALEASAPWIGHGKCFATAALLIVAGVAAVFAGAGSAAAALGVLAASLLVVGLVSRKRQVDLSAAHEALAGELAEVARQAAAPCEEVAALWPPTQAQLRAARNVAQDAAVHAVQMREQGKVREAARIRLAGARSAQQHAKKDLSASESALQEHKVAWAAWLAGQQLPVVSPAIAKALLRKVAEFQARHRELTGKENTLANLEARCADWSNKVHDALSPLAYDVEDAGVSAAVALAADAVRAEESLRRDYASVKKDLEAKRNGIARLGGKRRTAASTLDTLLSEHAVQTVLELEEARATTLQLEKLSQRAGECEVALRMRLGNGPRAEDALAELRDGVEAVWKSDVTDCDERLENTDDEIVGVVEERTAASARIRELEASVSIPGLELELGTLRCQAIDAAREWRRLQLANDIIGAALKKFREERQPDVLKEATHFFSRACSGGYDAIVLDDESEKLMVRQAGTLKHWDAAKLSSGTEEPLYLSMRLALAADFAKTSGPLPVLMDDVLLNVSTERRHEMIRVIAEFAQTQQVIFFTCHEHILEEFKRFASPHVVMLDDSDEDFTEEVA